MFKTSAFICYAFAQHSRYLVIGGGSGGLSISSHLIRSGVKPWQIAIVDPSPYHYYQPGWTMIGADQWQIKSTQQKMEETIPEGVHLNKNSITIIKPKENKVICKNGEEISYDELIVASGLRLQFQKVEGLKEALEDPNSKVASIYMLNYAQKMARLGSELFSGTAIFTEPPMPVKCAGAPQKILYLWTQKWLESKRPIKVEFMKSIGVMFGVPKYARALEENARRLNINVNFKHKLIKVSGNQATFEVVDTQEKVVRKFDLLHAVPPMGAHSYIADSGLADAAGYLNVDQYTLRHNEYPNIWGIGDCTSAPNAKTAAAIFSQTQTLNDNIMAVRNNPDLKQLPSRFQGYASCPLFMGGLKLMLAEFKYGGVIDETFYNNQEKPRYEFYFMKRFIFPLAYWFFVPRGLWAGRKGIRWV